MTVACSCGRVYVSTPDNSPIKFTELRCWNCPPKPEPKRPALRLVK